MPVYDTWKIKRGPDKGKLRPKDKRRKLRWQCHYEDPIAGKWRDEFFALEDDAWDCNAKKVHENNTGTFINEKEGRKLVSVYAPEWMAVQGLRDSSTESYERAFRLHILPYFGRMQMHAVRRSHVQGWIKQMTKEGYKGSTVRMWYSILAGMFKSAVIDRAIGTTPCVKIKLPDRARKNVWLPTPYQVAALHKVFAPRFALATLIASGCGLRWSEVMGLVVNAKSQQKSDIDFTRGKIKVRHQLWRPVRGSFCLTEPKTESGAREVDMPPYVAAAIKEHIAAGYTGTVMLADHTALRKAGTDPVVRAHQMLFVGADGEPLHRTDWTPLMRAAVKACGELFSDAPSNFTTHNLRHYFVSLLIDAGCSIVDVQHAVGHKDPATTLREYTHLFPTSGSKAVSHIEAAFAKGQEELELVA